MICAEPLRYSVASSDDGKLVIFGGKRLVSISDEVDVFDDETHVPMILTFRSGVSDGMPKLDGSVVVNVISGVSSDVSYA